MMKTLKVQIAMYFLIASIFMIALVGMIAYYSTSSIALDTELKNTRASVEHSGQYIEVYLQKLKAQADVIASDIDTVTYLTEESSHSKTQVMHLIENTLSTDPAFVSVVIVGKNGSILSNEKGLDMSVSSDMMKEAWYVDAINSEMPVLTSARQQTFTMDKDTWVISISQEIKDGHGENIGVLLMDIRYQVIEDYLVNMNLGQKGYAFIVNDEMNVVYHPDVTYFEDAEKRDALEEIYEKSLGYDADMGMLTHKYHIKDSNWSLIGLSSLDELQVIRRQLVEILVLAGLLIGMIAIGAGWFMAERISKPIKRLELAMLNFEEAMTPIIIDDKSCNEVVSLGEHYNKMVETIKTLMEEIKENETYLRNYEINALHSQINPHFLYNTLDTIVWMAEFNDSEKVIAVTKSLAQFFRLSLSKGQEMISLKDELEHVSQYLFIQKQRYDDQLNYKVATGDDILGLEDLEVPKIILQPIVENALYHGIREKGEPGHIEVSLHIMDDQVDLIVQDDGVGFDTTQPKKEKVKLGGVGIANVDQRLKLYYGENYGLKIESTLGEGTTVRLSLPRK